MIISTKCTGFWNPPTEPKLNRTLPDHAPRTEYVFRFDHFNVNSSRLIESMIDSWGNGCRYYHVFADSVEEAWELAWIYLPPQWKKLCDEGGGSMEFSLALDVNAPRHALYHRATEADPNEKLVFWLGWKQPNSGSIMPDFASWSEDFETGHSSTPRTFRQMNRYMAPMSRLTPETLKMARWSMDKWAEFRRKLLTPPTECAMMCEYRKE